MALRTLTCDVAETTDGLVVLEWLASTRADRHAQALAEARQLLDWAWREYGHVQGAAEDGGAWQHDLQVQVEAGGWHAVALTLTCHPEIAQACLAEFGEATGD